MKKVHYTIISVVVLLLLASIQDVNAQKEYRPLKTYIKKGGDINATMGIINRLTKDEDFRNDPELYYLAALCQKQANVGNNTKVYLKQAYDTLSFFNTTYGMFHYILQCDSIEQLRVGETGKKAKYRQKGYEMLIDYYPNLYNAGIFFTRKKDYPNAIKFWKMYLDAADSPLFKKANLIETDPKMPRAAFWLMSCSFEAGNYKDVFLHQEMAQLDTANADLYYKYRAVSYARLQDSVHYEQELINGMAHEPNEMYFFSNLSDYYNMTGQFDKSLRMTDSLLAQSPDNLLFKFGKAIILFNKRDYDNCIKISKEIIASDTANADAYYYVGNCYYNLALNIDADNVANINSKEYVANRQKMMKLMRESLPYLEIYRSMRPQDKERWAPLLYNVYLALNDEKKFTEMETILNQTDKGKK